MYKHITRRHVRVNCIALFFQLRFFTLENKANN